MKHIEKLNILFNECLVGQLNLIDKKIYFSYDSQWINQGFNLNPLEFKMTTEPQVAQDNLFQGLHGVFADSISDGWGLLLTDRALQKKFNWKKNEITQLDRLFFIGNRAMGGFKYRPADSENQKNEDFNLELILSETQKIISGEKEDIIKELYLSGGSPGGARPKAVFARKENNFCAGYDVILPGYEAWLIKFFSKDDSPESGKIEKAYADMAKDCGLLMPATDLIEVKLKNKKHSFFAIQRFDRNGNDRIHVASLSGLLYASHRVPSLSYKDILATTQQLCKSPSEVQRAFDLMLFNIIMHNKDDHCKNFSYTYSNNQWHLSPGYDLVFSNSLMNQHMSDLYGNGNPNKEDIIRIAKEFNIKNYDEKIDKFLDVASNWATYADKYSIRKQEAQDIKAELDFIKNNFFKKKSNKLKP